MRHAVMLAETIGVRVSGTEGERKAVAYLRAQLESFGYTVSVDSFTYEERTFRTAEVNAGGKVYQALTMVGSAVATVTAPAAFVGLADEAGLAGADLTGKVAVADRGVLTFAQKVEAVRAAGAVALIVINNEPGDLSGQLSGNSDLAVAGLAQEDGAALRAAARAGQPVRLKTTGTEQRTGLDVIARPAAGAACDIVVGGHHDTVPGAPGAHDNASGTAAVVELARAAAVGGLEPGVCFVAFGAEESGLFGSQDFVAKLETAGALPKFMLNIDMMGEGTRVDLVGTTTLVRQAAVIAERLGIPAQETTLGAQFGSDHQPFQRKGVLVVFFTSNEPGRFHTPHDTADRLQPAAIGRVGEIAFALIQDLVKQTG
jgi:Iap family predicted aminopeptidase